jgi:hypothetical protein
MTIAVANVANTNTFGAWLIRTNQIATIISTNTVTTDSSLGGSVTTGNSFVNGYFGVNTLVVNSAIVGGNLTTSNSILIASNLAIGNTSSNVVTVTTNSTASNTSIQATNISANASANINITSSNYNLNTTLLNANSSTVNFKTSNFTVNSVSNSTFNSNNFVVNSQNTFVLGVSSFTGNASFSNAISVTGNATFTNSVSVSGSTVANGLGVYTSGTVNSASFSIGSNFIANSTVLYSSGSANVSSLNINNPSATNIVNGNMTIIGNLVVQGVTTTAQVAAATANVVPAVNVTYSVGNTTAWWLNSYVSNYTGNTINLSGAASFSGNLVVFGTANVTGAVALSNSISVAGNSVISGTSNVVGAASYSNTLSVIGITTLSSNAAINGTLILDTLAQAYANSYTFVNTTSPANVDTFSTSSLRTVEYLVQLTDPSTSPPQYHATKILLIHDASVGTTPYLTEYATLYNVSSLGTFNAIYNSGLVGLQLTPATSNVVCKFIRTSITV